MAGIIGHRRLALTGCSPDELHRIRGTGAMTTPASGYHAFIRAAGNSRWRLDHAIHDRVEGGQTVHQRGIAQSVTGEQ